MVTTTTIIILFARSAARTCPSPCPRCRRVYSYYCFGVGLFCMANDRNNISGDEIPATASLNTKIASTCAACGGGGPTTVFGILLLLLVYKVGTFSFAARVTGTTGRAIPTCDRRRRRPVIYDDFMTASTGAGTAAAIIFIRTYSTRRYAACVIINNSVMQTFVKLI